MACSVRRVLTHYFTLCSLAWSIRATGRSGQPLGTIFSSTAGIKGDAYLAERAKVVITNFCFDGDPKCTTFLAGTYGSDFSAMVPYRVQPDRGAGRMFARQRRYLVPKVPALDPHFHILDWALIETRPPAKATANIDAGFQMVGQSAPHPESERDIIPPNENDPQRTKQKITALSGQELFSGRHIAVLGSEKEPQPKNFQGKEAIKWQPVEVSSSGRAKEVVTVFGNGATPNGGKEQKQKQNVSVQRKQELIIDPKQTPVQRILDNSERTASRLAVGQISEKYSLKRMKDATVIVQLSSIAQNWLSVYDHCKGVTLAKINISSPDLSPGGRTLQQQGTPLRRIIDPSIEVGKVISLSCNAILLTDFSYVPREGSRAFFFGSADAQPKFKLDVIDSRTSDPTAAVGRHEGEDILLELPPGTNMAGVEWVHLYDPRAGAALASFQLSKADKPPCLS